MQELGVKLFHRNTSSVELTHAGESFISHARGIMDAVEQLKQEMDDISQLRAGRVHIGSMPITGSHLLPYVLPAFKAAYPHIDVTLLEDSSLHLEKLTAGGGTDLSLLSLPLQEPTLTYEVIGEEKIDLAVPPGHPLAQFRHNKQGIQLSELANEPFILLKKGQGFRRLALELCKDAGFEPNIVFESNNMETIQSLVAAGMGVSLVPRLIARAKSSELIPVFLPLDPSPSRTLIIAYRRGRYLSKAAEAFIATFQSVMQTHIIEQQRDDY
ncbi:HTH-type transcriptional regulator GltC [compost metagenome]